MRPRNQPARDQLAAQLVREPWSAAPALAARLGVSVPTLHRLLQEQSDDIVTAGRARRTRYAWRLALRGDATPQPVYAVDAAGRAAQVAQLALVRPHGAWMDLAATGWPVPDESRDGAWPGLPYPLYDMRPQGYLGRQLAHSVHATLGVSANPDAWNDADVLHVLRHTGHDTSGDLIVGDPAFVHWQQAALSPPVPVKPRPLVRSYERLAEVAVASGVAGSSAAGEFPKFPAVRELTGAATPHVLVKFSGADASPAVRRWSDLLVAEHLSLESATLLPGVAAAKSRVVGEPVGRGGRTFLEVERFDRVGATGRRPLMSLGTLDAALVGVGRTDWTRIAARFHAAGLIDADDVQRIDHLWWFGRLIGNTDMHLGNLSLWPHAQPGRLALAPVYDMLPMLYAPLPGGELPQRSFEPPLPLPPQRDTWSAACTAAIGFWTRASRDRRIGAGFRRLCAVNARRLAQVAERV